MNRKTTNSTGNIRTETVQVGSARVKIYYTPKNGRDGFTVAYVLLGERKREYFSDHADAKTPPMCLNAIMLNRPNRNVFRLHEIFDIEISGNVHSTSPASVDSAFTIETIPCVSKPQ